MFVTSLSPAIIITCLIMCGNSQLLADYFFPKATHKTREYLNKIENDSAFKSSLSVYETLANIMFKLTAAPVEVNHKFANAVVYMSNTVAGSQDALTPDTVLYGDSDAALNITQLITKYGFPVEEHEVTTEDGYILKMFRIPKEGPPLVLQHGILTCSDDYILAGPDQAIGYQLWKDGYDVWMANSRGNKFSSRHKYLDPSQPAFWDFSWHEMGVYDFPAVIDYVLDQTGANTTKLVAHSQGTTAFFVMASEKPEYNKKVSVFVALAPVAYLTHMKSPPMRLLVANYAIVRKFLYSTGTYNLLPDNHFDRLLKFYLCGLGVVSDVLCSNIIFMLVGISSRFDYVKLPVFVGHYPAGSSTKSLDHFGQVVMGQAFRKFDYGEKGNLERYGAKTPGEYALELAVMVGLQDWLAQPQDVRSLTSRLPNLVEVHQIPDFSHGDFFFSKDIKTVVYPKVKEFLDKF